MRSLKLVFGVVVLGGMVLGTCPGVADDLPQQSNHKGIQVVPAPGPVTVDGKLDEWDRSGRIHVYGSRNVRDKFSADVHAMWDAEALYIGIHFRDPTPMQNNVDAEGAPYDGWQADAFQARFVTDGAGGGVGYKAIHVDAFYSSNRDFSTATFSYNAPMAANARIFNAKGKHVTSDAGFEMAFELNENGKGYAQEIRIPWSILFVEAPVIEAGMTFRFTGEFYWGKPEAIKWPQIFYQDPMSRPDRINTYKSPHNWGTAKLLAKGDLETSEPSVRDFDDDYVVAVRKIQGRIPIRVAIPEGAKRFTVAIEDSAGVRVRNLAGNEPVENYVVETKDGQQVVEVLWDGRRDGNFNYTWEQFVGDPAQTLVEPGTYRVRTLVHDGLSVFYAGNFYNPGNPAWPSADGSGGWLGDHAPPDCVAVMQPGAGTKRGVVFLSSVGGECGVPFIGVDRSGEKIWSWLRSTSRVFELAADDVHVYFGFSYAKRLYWGKVNPDTGEQVKFVGGIQDVKPPEGGSLRFEGMAAAGGHLVISLGAGGLAVYDTETAERRALYPEVRGLTDLAFLPDGRRIAGLRGGSPVIVNIEDGTVTPVTLPGTGKGTALTVDSRGLWYMGDSASQTVKIYQPAEGAEGEFEPLSRVGEPGGRAVGPYNALAMATPMHIAVEERDEGRKRLWVVEREVHGKFRRVSVWDVSDPAAPSYYREYVGNTEYQGSGGSLSDDIPNLGLYRGTLFDIDYTNYTYRPIEIMGAGTGQTQERGFGNGFHFFSDASGVEREYYSNTTRLWLRTEAGWKLVFNLLSTHAPYGGYAWGYRCNRKLEWYSKTSAFKPTGFTEEGAPIYDAAHPEPLPGDAGKQNPRPRNDVYRTQFGYLKQVTHGGANPLNVTWGHVHMHGYDEDGRQRWTYPCFWYGVHGASTAPLAQPGRIIGFIKWTGTVELGDHTYIGMRGYKGQDFIIRDDGLYVGELFRDFREAEKVLPDDKRIAGRDISETTLSEECYSGWMGKQRDGKIRLTYGHTDVRIVEVRGLETVRELPSQMLAIDDDDIAACRDFVPGKEFKRVTAYTVRRGEAFTPGEIDFRTNYLELREVTRATSVPRVTLRYDDENLYVAWATRDETPWVQRGTDTRTLFKSGDAVGLLVHPSERPGGGIGGTRIVLASPGGKDIAVVHRPKGARTAPFDYTSPVRTVSFAHVAEDDGIRFQKDLRADGYVIAATIPWRVIGLVPTPGAKFRADFEVVFGGDSTTHIQNVLRWMDAPDSVHDLPTESEIFPAKYGTLILE